MKEEDVQYVGDNYILALYIDINENKTSCIACSICGNIMKFKQGSELPTCCNKCKTTFDYILRER